LRAPLIDNAIIAERASRCWLLLGCVCEKENNIEEKERASRKAAKAQKYAK